MNKHNLTDKQLQQLQNIGIKLHQMRVAQNLTLETIAATTLISPRLLTAIEMADLDELPEPFYIQILVKKYAAAINAPTITWEIPPASPPVISRTHPSHLIFNFQLQSRHLYLLYILLVIISVRVITSLVERPVIVNQPAINNIDLQPIPELETRTTPVSQAQTAPQFVSQANNSAAVSVGINLQERCWLKVMIDGQVAFEGILPQGTKRQWSGQKEVTIRAGNAGGVVISFNNQQQQVLGAPGQVEEITYTVN
ncbi:MAG: helix-turn-helix domain-containing protein [Cyanobacteria bacterium J06623_7]